jgi:hypothetical protein
MEKHRWRNRGGEVERWRNKEIEEQRDGEK